MQNPRIETLLNESPNQTSASFLIKCARMNVANGDEPPNDDALRRYLLAYDVFIKTRSYAILNKVFFLLALPTSLAVAAWPVIAAVAIKWDLVDAAILQTVVTAVAALFIYVYRHYKQRQMFAENLLRMIVFSQEAIGDLAQRVADEMARIDQGFAFRQTAQSSGPR